MKHITKQRLNDLLENKEALTFFVSGAAFTLAISTALPLSIALIPAAAIAAATYKAHKSFISNVIYKAENADHLDDNEKKIISDIFNNSVNTDNITKAFINVRRKKTLATFNYKSRTVKFFGYDESPIFDRMSISSKSTFIHEMTHAWQGDNYSEISSNLKNVFNSVTSYRYKLEEGKKFIEYGLEQQAMIMEDYYTNFLNTSVKIENYSRECINYNPELIKNIVEEQFPNTKAMREELEEKDKIIELSIEHAKENRIKYKGKQPRIHVKCQINN